MTEAEWSASNDVKGMLRILDTKIVGRKGLLFAAHCCRRVWNRLQDPRTRLAVETAELLADRECTTDIFRSAVDGAVEAWTAAMHAADVAGEATRVDSPLAKYDSQVYREARALAWGADTGRKFSWEEWGIADAVANSVRTVAGDRSPWADFAVPSDENPERVWQALLLIEMFWNPFRPTTFIPEWRTSTALAIAQGMYESRDFSAMPILADALQDAGCEDENVLSHCRGHGPHVRGCWVVDLILGKE